MLAPDSGAIVSPVLPGHAASSPKPWGPLLRRLGILALVVAASRAPFLVPGYGVDPDAWRVANAARRIAATGRYTASRFPGYPVQEFVCAALPSKSAWVANSTTALLSVLAVACFFLILEQIGCRDAMAGALAFAMTRVMYVHSVCLLDYVWAIAFVSCGYWLTLRDRPCLAGICLGLAIGCRITSGAMLLPLAVVWLWPWRAGNVRRLAIFAVASLAVGAICWLPVWLRYGPAFFTYYPSPATWKDIAIRATWPVWGGIGTAGLAIGTTMAVWTRFRQGIAWDWQRHRHLVAGVLGLLLYAIAFIRLPLEAGYLLPAVPLLLLVLAILTERRVYLGICACLALSSLVDVGPRGLYAGAIFRDHAERAAAIAEVQETLRQCPSLPPGSVVVCDRLLPLVQAFRDADVDPLTQDFQDPVWPIRFVYGTASQMAGPEVKAASDVYAIQDGRVVRVSDDRPSS